MAYTRSQQTPRHGVPQTYRIVKFVVGSFGLYSILLIEGSILVPCLRCGSNFAKKGDPIIESRGAPRLVINAAGLDIPSLRGGDFEMGCACNTHGDVIYKCNVLSGELEGKRPLLDINSY